MANTAGVVQYLLNSYGNAKAHSAMYEKFKPLMNLKVQLTQGGGRTRDKTPTMEGAAALELFCALRDSGAQPQAAVMQMAAKAGHVEVVKELLGMRVQGMELNAVLLLALEHGKHLERTVELVRLLEGAGAVAGTDEQCSALMRNRDFQLASRLLDALGLLQVASKPRLLQLALEAGNGVVAIELLDAGTEPPPGALSAQCAMEDDILFERLLRAGADPRNFFALVGAARSNHAGRVRQLLAAAALPPDHYSMCSALHAACAAGSVEAAQVLAAAGGDAAAGLKHAAEHGRTELVRALLANSRYAMDGPALHAALGAACSKGHLEAARALLGAGADPLSGLIDASRCGGPELVRLLLAEAEAARGGATTSQASAVAAAVAHEAVNVALWYACDRGHTEVAWALLDAGADPLFALPCSRLLSHPGLEGVLLEAARAAPGGAEAAAALVDARRKKWQEFGLEMQKAGIALTPIRTWWPFGPIQTGRP